MNKLILMGRLTRDPELTYSKEDTPRAIAKYTIAVDRRFKKNKDDVDFFNCVSFGAQAEFVDRYMKLGVRILVTGRIQSNNYTNNDGVKIYGMQVLVEEVEFADGKAPENNKVEENSSDDGFVNVPTNPDQNLPFN